MSAQNIASGLKAYWNMDNLAGATVPDASPNGYAGTLTGSAAGSANGKAGGCLEMAVRQNGYVPFPGLTWQPTAFSVAFWINPQSHSDWSNQLGSSMGWGGFIFHTDPGGGIHTGTDVNGRIAMGAGTVALNQWQHFAFVYEAGTGRLYKDGVLLTSKTGMAAPVAWGGFYIGNPDPRGTLHGRLDEVRIYERAITAQEVERLMAYPHTPATYTWNGSAGTDWNTAANWTPASVPGPYDDAVVNACTTCPMLSGNATLRTLSLNTGSRFTLGAHTLRMRGAFTLNNAAIQSSGGTLSGGADATVAGCDIRGDIRFEKTGGNMTTSWNTYRNKLTVINQKGGGILNIGDRGGEVFEGEVFMENQGYGITVAYQAPWFAATTTFKEKATFLNATSSTWAMSVGGHGTVVFDKDVVLQNASNCTFYISGKVDFSSSVSVQNLSPSFSSVYGNRMSLMGGNVGPVTFHGHVTVSNTSNQFAGYTPVDVRFGEYAGNKKCVFKPGSKLEVGTAGFQRGNLILENCELSGPSTILTLASGGAERFNSNLVLGKGTVFSGMLTATTPRLQLNGAVFNGEATLTKTGSGTDNSAGGNVFKRKVIIDNKAPAGSLLNMATQADDIIQQ